MSAVELTGFSKNNGPLTKRISLAVDGAVKSDGSACVMTRGTAQRLRIADIGELAAVIEKTRPHEAIALGALRAGLPEKVRIVTKQKLNGQPNTIARTAADILFRKEKPALALIDFDAKGIPPEVAAEMQRLGGFWPALLLVLPALRPVAHLIRRSTSAGLFRTDTGERLPGSGGLHAYLSVRDGADVERFLRTLHERCWLAGLGWMMVGAGGQLLERSIVDRMVGAPERLVFEGGPILKPPVGQDREVRRPVPVDGEALDTVAACPLLSIVESSKLRALKARQAQWLAPESAKARAAFVAAQTKRLAERTGMSEAAAAQEIARQCEGVLLPDVELPFDDDEFAGCTVGDVLADPERFEGATLADPLEGVDYGTCKARIMRRADGAPWIHSFAHGCTTFQLKHNAATVRAAMQAASARDAVKTFVTLSLSADLNDEDIEALRNEAAERSRSHRCCGRRSGSGRRSADNKSASAASPNATIRARRSSPYDDAPWLPPMDVLNDAIGATTTGHPTVRDIDSVAAFTSEIAVPETHAFTATGANSEEGT
jgi:hypothetical protein